MYNEVRDIRHCFGYITYPIDQVGVYITYPID